MDDTLNSADLAFEGAQGFGARADGGRGGEIVKVTTLADSGPGSLRWALEELEGPRIVVFDVSGEIALNDSIYVNGDVTIAGQTSPEGITISGAKLRIVESDVIVRGLHFRPGDGPGDSGDERDGISIGSSKQTVENVIIDHNSFSWSVDEQVTLWYGPKNVTLSNNIFAEALQDSIHPEGRHSMGVLVGDGSSNVTIVGNLFAHNQYRNALVKDDSKQVEFINNVIYNYGPEGFYGAEGSTAHIIGNVYIPGADSAERAAIRLLSPEPGAGYYLSDNVSEVYASDTSIIHGDYVFTPSDVTVMSASEAYDYVLENAGSPFDSSIDARIKQMVIDGTGRIIDSPDEVGGYETVANPKPPSDRDNDGMPDSYEASIGTNPDVFDAHGDVDGNGVSNIEDYINGLLEGFVNGGSGSQPPSTGGEESETVETPSESTDPGTLPTDGGTDAIRIEAEDFNTLNGFYSDTNSVASGGAWLRVKEGQSADASTIFSGEGGTYNLVIGYFDEADGVSNLSVMVNGKVVDSWQWDQNLGSNYADKNTQAQRVIENVQINPGDVITLSGTGDGKEPLRVDYVELQPQASDSTLDRDNTQSQDSSQDDAALPAPPGELPVYKVEAETLNLESGWRVDKNPNASGDALIREYGNGQSKASMTFEGESGVYDMAINYFDESDGVSYIEVLVDGEKVDSWSWDQETNEKFAGTTNRTSRVIEDVEIMNGDTVVLQGYGDGGEPLRVDDLEFYADTLFA